MARIFAKALNCTGDTENPPCCQCDSCKRIAEGSFLDVMEIDAASHTSVEMVREYIIDKVVFAPMEGKYKIYIIDEAHKLSNASFNALLKTLEEPPKHVVFILATTHPNELLPTIISRCQRFDFKRISQSDIVEHLRNIAQQEGYIITEQALNMIASASSGSLRDALVILEQAFSFSDGEITPGHITSLLGISDIDFLFRCSKLVSDGNIKELLLSVNKLVKGGKDLFRFVRDLIEHYRALLIAKYSDNPAAILDMSEESVLRYIKDSEMYDRSDLPEIIKLLSELQIEMKEGICERALLEASLVKIASGIYRGSISLERRISRLERKLTGAVENKVPPQPAKQEVVDKAPVDKIWTKLLEVVKMSKIYLYGFLSDTRPDFKSDTELIIKINNSKLHKKQIDENIPFLEEQLYKLSSKKIKVTTTLNNDTVEIVDDRKKRHEEFVNNAKTIFSHIN